MLSRENHAGKWKKIALTMLAVACLAAASGGIALLWQQGKSGEQANNLAGLKILVEKYIAAGQFDEAFDLLNQAVQGDPDNAELQELLNRILVQKTQEDQQRAEVPERSPSSDDSNKLIEDLLRQNTELQNRTAALWQQLERSRTKPPNQKADNTQNAQNAQGSKNKNADNAITQSDEAKQNMRNAQNRLDNANNELETLHRALAEARKNPDPNMLDELIDEILAKNPEDSAANTVKAKRIEQEQGDTPPALREAEKLYRKALKAAPEQAEAQAGLAQNLDKQSRLQEAVQAYDKALEKFDDPFDSELSYLRGIALYRLGQYPKAVRSLREYIDGNGQNLRVFYALGLSYRQLQRGAEAMESFGEALAKGLKHAATYWELAKLKLEQQDAKKALEYVDEALSLKEGDGRYLQTKGSALFHLKRYREAADMFRQADGAGVEPSERGLVNYNMGLSYLNSAQYPQAEKAFLQAIRLDGSKPEYVLGLADSQIAAGKSEEARKHLASAVKKFPDNAELLLIQGNIFFKAKEYEAALEVFRKAYRQNPKDRKVINNLGLAYMNTEQFEQSRSFFRKAIVEDPINSDLWFNLALVDVATEQHEGAIAALEKTLSLDASDGKKSDAYYLLCKEYFAAGRADEARETLVRLRRANPKDAKIVELEKLLAE